MEVIFWPKDEGIAVSKCNHRYGAEMTISVQTDSRFRNSIYAAEWYAFKNDMRIGAFINNILSQYEEDLRITEDTGVYRHDIYYATDYWKNPQTNVIERIPDYMASQWTAAGAAYFNVNVGDPKNPRTPSHGQEMYDLSNGAYGMDYATGQLGASGLSEVFGIDDSMQNWFFNIFGRYPSAGSYRNGDNRGWPTHLPRWLSFRNSSPSPSSLSVPAPTQYGAGLGYPSVPTNRDLFINYPSSIRPWDAIYSDTIKKDPADVRAYIVTQTGITLLNHGWERIFIHFHSMDENNTLSYFDEMYGAFKEATGEAFVWKCSNGEAMEYMFARDSVKRIAAVTREDKIVVVAEFENYFNVRTDLLNIPLSVEIDLTGTILAAKNVKASYGKLVALGADRYILEIPFKDKFSSVVLFEGEGGIFETEIPVLNYSRSGNVLTVTSDIPTKAVLYAKASGASDDRFLPVIRDNFYDTGRQFTLEADKEYGVGAITEFGRTAAIKVI